LRDPAYQAARIDTGYLDRLLQHKPKLDVAESGAAEVAAIAAGLFAILEPQLAASVNGASRNGVGESTLQARRSDWKQAARAEALH
jgi:hypothetical protein